MNKVKVLGPEIISKIAAGEVIERPASAIKELLENSLDAGAQSIEVKVKQYGKALIALKDSGSGIERDDLEKIFQRHATSKISKLDDLYAIDTLGFRGEALYSIAAISDVTLRSKTAKNDTGWEIHLRGGKTLSFKPVSMPTGTEIEIKELFFNTPARKKFLKSDPTELRQIVSTVMPYALIHPEIRFSLSHYRKSLLAAAPQERKLDRISQVLNLNKNHILSARQNIPEKDISVEMFLGDINIQRPQKNLQFIFVNGRPVHNSNLQFHLNQAYRLILPDRVYPFFMVNMAMPASELDVNVHPTKREVKLKNEKNVIAVLRQLAEKTLLDKGEAKQLHAISSANERPFYQQLPQPQNAPVKEPARQYMLDHEQMSFISEPQTLNAKRQDDLKSKLNQAVFIGRFSDKYLLFQTGSSLLIVDQHAAQERITFEDIIQHIEQGDLEIQNLLTPVILKLSPDEMVMWEVLKDKIEKVGFSTTLWDKESVALHALPALIAKPEIALRNLLAGQERQQIDTEALARRACRNSLMAGYKIDANQAAFLLKTLAAAHDPFTCPHGRPTVVELNEHIIEKHFLRQK